MLSLLFAVQEEELWADQPEWLLDQSSWHVICACAHSAQGVCACTGCSASPPWLSAAGEWTEVRGEESPEHNLCRHCLVCCALLQKKHHLFMELLAAGRWGSQNTNGIKRNCTSPQLVAHEWLLNDVSDTTLTQRFLAMERRLGRTGRTAMLVFLSRLFPKVWYFLILLLDFILGSGKTLKAFPTGEGRRQLHKINYSVYELGNGKQKEGRRFFQAKTGEWNAPVYLPYLRETESLSVCDRESMCRSSEGNSRISRNTLGTGIIPTFWCSSVYPKAWYIHKIPAVMQSLD